MVLEDSFSRKDDVVCGAGTIASLLAVEIGRWSSAFTTSYTWSNVMHFFFNILLFSWTFYRLQVPIFKNHVMSDCAGIRRQSPSVHSVASCKLLKIKMYCRYIITVPSYLEELTCTYVRHHMDSGTQGVAAF